jgi:hypothetical protein
VYENDHRSLSSAFIISFVLDYELGALYFGSMSPVYLPSVLFANMPGSPYPPQDSVWRNRMVEIPYKKKLNAPKCLKKRHPVTRGILPNLAGRLVSIQMLVPNKPGYLDSFFLGGGFKYHKSKRHGKGNAALERALERGECFCLFLGFKSNDENTPVLFQLGVPVEYHGKSYVMGIVKIRDQDPDDGGYWITPCGVAERQEEENFRRQSWWVVNKEGKEKRVQPYPL